MSDVTDLLKEIRFLLQKHPLKLTSEKILGYLNKIFGIFESSMCNIDNKLDIMNTKFMLDIIVMWGIICRLSFRMDTTKFPVQIQKMIAIGRSSLEQEKKTSTLGSYEVVSKSVKHLHMVYSQSKYFRVVLNEYYLSYLYLACYELEESSEKFKTPSFAEYIIDDNFFLTKVPEYYIYRNFLFLILLSGRGKNYPPKFLSKLKNILSRTFLRKNGLKDLFRIFLSELKFEWSQYERIIQKIVLTPPKFCKRVEYFKNISSQLVEIISKESSKWFVGIEFTKTSEEKKIIHHGMVKLKLLVFLTFSLISSSNWMILRSEIFSSSFFKPVIKSFHQPVIPSGSNIIFPESSVEPPILFLHGLVSQGRLTPNVLYKVLLPFIDPFFVNLFVFTSGTVYRMKTEVENIFRIYFSKISVSQGFNFLKIHLKFKYSSNIDVLEDDLFQIVFSSGETGGVCISKEERNDKIRDDFSKRLKCYQFLVDCILSRKYDNLEIETKLGKGKKKANIEKPQNIDENQNGVIGEDEIMSKEIVDFLIFLFSFLEEEKRDQTIMILPILRYVLGKYSDRIGTNANLFPLLHKMLSIKLKIPASEILVQKIEEDNEQIFPKKASDKFSNSSEIMDVELCSLSIYLLHVLLTSGELSLKNHHVLLSSFIPLLDEKMKKFRGLFPHLFDLSKECIRIIKEGSYQFFGKEEFENFGISKIGSEESSETSKSEENLKKEEFVKEMKEIMKDLKDSTIPMRAFGMSRLRKLVTEKYWKQHLALSQVIKVLDIFQKQLLSSDSFCYMSAIRGLEVMGEEFPEKAIPILSKIYMNPGTDPVLLLKIGQSLIRVAEKCGEVISKYANFMVHPYLQCIRSHDSDLLKEEIEELEKRESEELEGEIGKEEKSEIDENVKQSLIRRKIEEFALVRASALSNLSEIVKLLKFGIFPYLQDIIDCCLALMIYDDDCRVRRASILVIHFIAVGFLGDKNNGFFSTLEDQVKEICVTLKKVRDYDKDNITVENAKRTLDLIAGMAEDIFVTV